jgi:cytochrome c-type biogenesis protein CcmH
VTTFWTFAALLCGAAVAMLLFPLWRQRRMSGRWSPGGLAAAFAIVPVAVLIYATLSTWDPELQHRAEEGERVVAQLAERMKRTPDDVEGWLLLARSYMTLGRAAEGRDAYREAWLRTPVRDNDLKVSYAEAQVLADRAELSGDAGRLFEEVLAADPNNVKALWYGGLVAIEGGREDELAARWTRLLQLDVPPELKTFVQAQLTALDAPATAGVQAAGEAPSGTTIKLTVTLGAGRAVEQLGPNAALFIFASAPGGGPPVAVIRRPASAVPGEFTLSDANSMIPGRSLGAYEELTLVARLSKSGQPGEQAGDWKAQTVVRPRDVQAVALVIDQVVQ